MGGVPGSVVGGTIGALTRSKHSGSGRSNDIPGQLTQVDALYQQTIGRPATQAEKEFLVGWISNEYSAVDLAKLMMTQAAKDIQAVKTEYKIAFGEELTPAEAAKLYTSGLEITYDIRGDSYALDAARAQIKVNFNKSIKDPTFDPRTGGKKLATDDQVTQARELISKYGLDPEDPEMLMQVTDAIMSGMKSYEIAAGLKNTPEYQKIQADEEQAKFKTEAEAARGQLSTELLRQQQEAFAKAQPQILSGYMKAGRLNSSSVDAALANAQKELESQRQAYMGNIAYQDAVTGAGYNRQDFLNNTANAFAQYQAQNQPWAVQRANAFQSAYSTPIENMNTMQQRNWNMQDWNLQKSYYDEMNRADANNGFAGALSGAGTGAMTGASVGGPWGTLIGGLVGGGIGYFGTRRK